MKEQFLFDIKVVVEMEEIPLELIINWNQTGITTFLLDPGLWRKKEQNELKSQQ